MATNLKRGSKGDEVKNLQTLLNSAGYSLDVDGSFGPATERAVRDYQTKNNLKVDGIAGVNTLGSLNSRSTTGNAATGEVANNAATQAPTTPSGQTWLNTSTNSTSYTPIAPTTLNTVYLSQYETGRPEYSEDPAVTQALEMLRAHEANRPGEYQGTYDQQIQQILSNIENRGPFQYDFNADPLYQQYRQQYVNQGQQAMMDTMGNAAALTGGYGNSYATTAGQQAYNQYLGQLNNVIPELQQAAYNRYQDELNNDYNRLNMYQNLDQTAYGRYRDTLSDYYNDLDYYYRQYGDMSDRDYQRYLNDVDAWNNDRAYWYNRANDELSQNNWMNQFAYQQAQDRQAQENADREYALKLASLSASGGSGGGGGGSSSGNYDNWYKQMLSNALDAYKKGGPVNLSNQLQNMLANGDITTDEYARLLNETLQTRNPSSSSPTTQLTQNAYTDYYNSVAKTLGAATGGNTLQGAAASMAAAVEEDKKKKKSGKSSSGSTKVSQVK